ncbi:MAG: transposase [bacterium]|nr:transposase [bacterium]
MDIRRYHIPGAVFFITCVNHQRKPIFSKMENVVLLMNTLSEVQKHYSHHLYAYVILPDHFHFLLEPEQCTISAVIQSLRRNFTCNYKRHHQIEASITLAQHRFYDHVIRDERDMEKHLDYIHYNPVKHGLTGKPEAWPHSSYRDFVREGHYEIGWGWKEIPGLQGMNPE